MNHLIPLLRYRSPQKEDCYSSIFCFVAGARTQALICGAFISSSEPLPSAAGV